jgi:ribonuclease III
LKFVRRIYNYHFHKDRELARRLRTLLGFTPIHLSLFKLAFFHKSTFTSRDYAISNNERLEFLGDAVLSTIVGEYLFKKYPDSDEGFLTKMRSKIVKRNSLDEIADRMGLDMYLAHYNQTRLSKSMLGNSLEALVGAIYIELGYEGTRKYVVKRILRRYLDIHNLEVYDDNFKSQLLEWCQKNGHSIDYKVLTKYKSDKRDKFKVAVLVNGKKVGTADDFNKKSAEQLASERAMQALGIIGGKGGDQAATARIAQADLNSDEYDEGGSGSPD